MEKGKTAFLAHYRQLFGDRLEPLLTSELRPPCVLVRPDQLETVKQLWLAQGYSWQPVTTFTAAIHWPKEATKGIVLPGYTQGYVYPLSQSSLLPVTRLEIQPADEVLDACAAPGGKTLALAMTAERVVANDLSPGRVRRLKKVIRDFGVADRVEVMQQPMEILARRIDRQFDKVLIDAPCSSELHVWHSPKHLAQWTHKRIEGLKKRQLNLIQACLPLVKPGGRLVYATCALTPEENEAVVSQVKADGFLTLPEERIWPDQDHLEPIFTMAWDRIR